MVSTRLSILLLLAAFAVSARTEDAPTVRTPLGGIKGYYKVSANGRQYEAYEGIPYALPPVGKLRFKAPQRVPTWTGDLVATKFGSPCLQFTQIPVVANDKVEGSEDCLYLNIYVPVREKNVNAKPMPVLFWIHGGAFQFGSGMSMGAKYLMDRDVILVTINYRLGPLGFLSTQDNVVSGNMGLKDQSMALRWVSENIEWFGGDKKRVTLVGLSAGGASVHYQYLSPMSAGLFQGGISISGTSFDCWTQTENALEKAKQVGAMMGCPTVNTKEMVRCLRYRPSRALVETVGSFMKFLYNPFTPFGPVAERNSEAPFIDRSPVEIVQSGDVNDVPWVTGVTSEEGLYPVAEFIADEKILKTLDENWDLLAPHFLDYNFTIPREKHVEIAHLIKKHYFGSRPIDKSTVKGLIQLASDRFFVADSVKAARMQAKANTKPVWYYYYTYRGVDSLSNAMTGTTEDWGVSHADDAYFVLDTEFINPTTTANDRKMQQLLINLWVSLATDGVPNVGGVEWPRLNPADKKLQYLHIASPDKVVMDGDSNFGQQDFWNSIDFNENKVKNGAVKEEL